MAFLWVTVLVFFTLSVLQARSTHCPCSRQDFCFPVVRDSRPEVYTFIISANPKTYSLFEWNKITTLSVKSLNNALAELVCYAHERHVKVTIWFNFDVKYLTNLNARKTFIKGIVDSVEKYYLDGINIDFENPLRDPKQIRLLTDTVRELTASVKKLNSTLQVSFSHFPFPIPFSRYSYDVKSISQIVDFIVIMDYNLYYYHLNGTFCLTGANSGYPDVMRSIKGFLELGIPADKLVATFPWYGYRVKCLYVDPRSQTCTFTCGKQHSLCYSSATHLLRENSTSGRHFNVTTSSPFFFYSNSSDASTWRVDYDDMWSLEIKIKYSLHDARLRGVGVFRLDCLTDSPSEYGIIDRQEMWNAVPNQDKNNVF